MRHQINPAEIVELWGDGPIFPGPGWRLSWRLDTENQQQINSAILSDQLWATLQDSIPDIAMLSSPFKDANISRAKPEVLALTAIGKLADSLLKPANLEVRQAYDAARLRHACIVVHSDHHELAGDALRLSADLILICHLAQKRSDLTLKRYQRALKDLAQRLRICCGHTLTMAQLEEARRRGIPTFLIDSMQRIYQLGTGVHSRWTCSSSNDHDSAYGMDIASDKSRTNDLLRQLGFPVPKELQLPHNINDQQLIAAANQIGYPCVLKPKDGEQGRGVAANITNTVELLKGASRVKAHTRNELLLQKHIQGDDFRINVVGDKITFAIKRTPPMVTGNNMNTILELIQEENTKRRKMKSQGQIAGIIDSNDSEVKDFIQRAGFSLNSILPLGHRVQLRGNANVSTGGLREDVQVDSIHPVIRQQCLAIARTLRLEICGIDYISADISAAPWNCPGAFIEANSMPQNSAIRAASLLDNLFPSDKPHSVPEIVILGDWERIVSIKARHQINEIIDSNREAAIGIPAQLLPWLDSFLDKKYWQRVHIYKSPRELLLNRTVRKIIHFTSPKLVLRLGLPAPRHSLVIKIASNNDLKTKDA